MGGNTLSGNLSFAAGLAALGLTLRDSQYKGTASLTMARELVENAASFDPNGYRAQLLKLIRNVK